MMRILIVVMRMMIIMMMVIGIHHCWLATVFNVQLKIVPPFAHLGYELRKIKMLLYEANNMHIL